MKVGDEVVIHHGWWDREDPWVRAGGDPMVAPSARIWGYDGPNYGAFGQFAVAQAHQCMPKADHLTWEEAAAPSLVGTTAYRMLFGWEGNTATVGEYCVSLGATGYIDRTEFSHWGTPPHWTDADGQKAWMKGARAFGARIWDIVGERRSPAIVFEHLGEDTVPTSVFVCDGGGMVVICAGTSGYSALVDLRYHWVRQKRLQGSHGTNDRQAYAYNELVRAGKINPAMTRVLPFDEIGRAHQEMDQGRHGVGNTAILVGAPKPGLGGKPSGS